MKALLSPTNKQVNSRFISLLSMLCCLLFLAAASGRAQTVTSNSVAQFAGTYAGIWTTNTTDGTATAPTQSGRFHFTLDANGRASGEIGNATFHVTAKANGQAVSSGICVLAYRYQGDPETRFVKMSLLGNPDGRSRRLIFYLGSRAAVEGVVGLVKVGSSSTVGNRAPSPTTHGFVVCPYCHGLGNADRCIRCKGTGDSNEPGRPFQNPYQEGYVPLPRVECPSCHGTGRVCYHCHNTGKIWQ